ncbi:hypothetical protein P389DRAFT_104762 [Cystobasidium minutum MCA 4210]|uniref:uncharacterized protein n=1 Tax=Cystobasidium minutum MCA 4210 TaxID=1397322 RepID=UPI0034CDFD69|eukprot:jgi/Rhomi1/104762/CE104761_379
MRPDSATVDDFIATVDYWFCSDPPSHLECVICHSILKNPVCCDSGKHTFCLECVLKWQEKQPVSYAMTTQCPIDRGGLGDGYQGLRRPPLLVQECIDTLRVRCSLACGWTGQLSEWRDHLLQECPVTEGQASLRGFVTTAEASMSQIQESSDDNPSGTVPTALRRAEVENSRLAQDTVNAIRQEMYNVVLPIRQEVQNILRSVREEIQDSMLPMQQDMQELPAREEIRHMMIPLHEQMQNSVASLREELQEIPTGLHDEIQAKVGPLEQEIQDMTASLRKEVEDVTKALRKELHNTVAPLRKDVQNVIEATRQENEKARQELRAFLLEEFRNLSTQISKAPLKQQQSQRKVEARIAWQNASADVPAQVPAKVLLPASKAAAAPAISAPATPAAPLAEQWTTVTASRRAPQAALAGRAATRELSANEWPDITHIY